MSSFEGALLDFRRLDRLAAGDSGIHRLDARTKVLVTLVYIITVVSFDRYELAALFPFFIFPVAMVAGAALPAGYLVRKICLLCPFVLMVALCNPLLDRETLVHVGTIPISGGWVSFASILVRTMLTVGAAFVLVGITGFAGICHALERLGMPQVFTVQLLYLYRYLSILTGEALRAARARELRSCGKKGLGIGSFSSLVGHLLIRTWQRAERIHLAMLTRCFTGTFHTGIAPRFGRADMLFLLGWTTLFILFRLHNIPRLLGTAVLGVLP